MQRDLRYRMLFVIVCAAALLMCAYQGGAATDAGTGSQMASGPAKPFDPAVTKVAVIPFLNNIGQATNKDQIDACTQATDFITQMFANRGFQMMDPKAVMDAMGKLQFNVKDVEEQNKANFLKLGQELGANLVVFGTVSEFSTSLQTGFWASRKVGKAKAEVRVYDPAANVYWVNQNQLSEKGGSFIAPTLTKSLAQRQQALNIALDTVMKEFMKPYPEKPAAKKEPT